MEYTDREKTTIVDCANDVIELVKEGNDVVKAHKRARTLAGLLKEKNRQIRLIEALHNPEVQKAIRELNV